jgi:hypothetical protein
MDTPRRSRSRPKTAQPVTPALTDVVLPDGMMERATAEAVPDSTFKGERVSFSSREARIQERAYELAERCGFSPGREIDDWLEAERDIDREQSFDPR